MLPVLSGNSLVDHRSLACQPVIIVLCGALELRVQGLQGRQEKRTMRHPLRPGWVAAWLAWTDKEILRMAIRPEEVAPDAVSTQPPPTPPTPQPDGKDRGTWNGWPSRNTAQPLVLIDDQERITRIRTPVMDLEGHMTPTHLFYVVQHFAVPE